MIRRTVARAFGGSPSGRTAGAWPAEEAAGSAAIERFLRDLHRALEEIAAGEPAAGSQEHAAGSPESGAEPPGSGPGSAESGAGAEVEGAPSEEPGAGSQRARAGSGRPRGRPGRRLRLNRPETLPEGIEFALAGPGGAVRFLDTLLGFVRVFISGDGGEGLREEVLSLHPEAGAQRPVWKPLATPAAGRHRTAFRFTSVHDLAARYAAIASGDNR